jgi:hypothetical protein
MPRWTIIGFMMFISKKIRNFLETVIPVWIQVTSVTVIACQELAAIIMLMGMS